MSLDLVDRAEVIAREHGYVDFGPRLVVMSSGEHMLAFAAFKKLRRKQYLMCWNLTLEGFVEQVVSRP